MHRLPDFRLPDLKLPRFSLPSPRLRGVRVPSPRVSGLRRPAIDLDDPSRLGAHLQFFFYLLMFVALLAIFAGATGTGVLMLVAGAALHVLRSSLAEVSAQRRARRERAGRKKQVRLRAHRAARKARPADEEIRVTAAPRVEPAPRAVAARTAAARAAATPRASATPRLGSRRRPAVAQPGPSPARKQRVI